jgi:hypothetical protein
MTPNAHFRQHHRVEAPLVDGRHFRPHFRILTRLDGLLADRLITTAEFHAAVDFRELVELARAGTARSTLAGIGNGGPRTPHEGPGYRTETWDRLRAICAAVGRRHFRLLILSVVDDATWKALGRRFKIDHRTARKRVAEAIGALRRA